MLLIISIIHTIIIGLADALIKGNIIASHGNNWAQVPWYLKDENLIYPVLIFLSFGLLLALFIKRKTTWGWTYLATLIIWILGGLESLSYWFWIAVLRIKQTMWWLPDDSFFWWYPKEVPWLNKFVHLKLITVNESGNVSREAVIYGVIIAFSLNILVYFYQSTKEKLESI